MRGRYQVWFLALLVACDQPGTCQKPTTQTPALTAFETHGKVLVTKSLEGHLSNPMFSQWLNEGTELTVVVDHNCQSNAKTRLKISDEFPVEKGIRSHRWKLSKRMDLEELKSAALEDECIIGISRPTRFHKFSLDPDLSRQPHLQTIKALSAAPLFFGPRGITSDVVIAIIDTGLDLEHDDLKDNIWTNSDEVAGNGIDDDRNGYTDDVHGYNFPSRKGDASFEAGEFHGTHVAGLAAARYDNGRGGSGVIGQRVKLMSLNVFGRNSGAETEDIDNAIRYAADNGANVINMSLGGRGATPSTESAIRYAITKGAIVIVAAGNENRRLDDSYFLTPASYGPRFTGMLTVGSIDVQGEQRSSFSNYSTSVVEIAAPGANSSDREDGLYSTLLSDQYGKISGTSMSSPIVAGAAGLAFGLVKARGGTPTPALIEGLLLEAGRRVNSLQTFFKGPVVDVEALYYLIDARFSGGSTPPPVAEPTPTPEPQVPAATPPPTEGTSPEPSPCQAKS